MFQAQKNPNDPFVLRDAWDHAVEYIRSTDGPFGLTVEKMLDYDLNIGDDERLASDEKLKKLFAPDAMLFKSSETENLEAMVRRLYDWMQQQPEFDAREFEAFVYKHHPQLNDIEDRGYVFVGRGKELEELERHLASGDRMVALHGRGVKAQGRTKRPQMSGVAALKGFGGQGKTALAHAYASRQRNNYAAILWLNAESLNLEAEIAASCTAFQEGLIERPSDRSPIVRCAKYLIQIVAVTRGRVLVVVDDIPTEQNAKALRRPRDSILRIYDALQDACPAVLPRFDFLLTGRQQFEPTRTINMAVERLSREDAVNLFRTRADRNDLAPDNESLLDLVDETLGGHALSITLVASLARERKIHNLDTLIELVKNRIVDARGPLETVPLEEDYPASLYASFLLAFEAVSQQAQSLLYVLGLFRRDDLTFETIRNCARAMPDRGALETVQALREEVNRDSGSYPGVNELVAHSLLERIDRTRKKDALWKIRLHEVIYDFMHAEWSAALNAGDERTARLRDLELRLTEGACTYASERINAEQIRFVDLETLTGFLLPIVNVERRIIPARDRVERALSFWFEHFKFQNFVYDTGLQELLAPQMEALLDHLMEQNFDDERFFVVLKKLIGHAFYADPFGESAARAGRYFDEALTIARAIEDDPRYRDQKREVQWYRVFLLNHRSNLASKNRKPENVVLPIWDDPDLAADSLEIEATLPDTLKSLDRPPSLEECELLVRSAIYWGHRGNQDNYIMYQRVVQDALGDDWSDVTADALRQYVYAASFRLLTLRMFRHGRFEALLMPLVRRNALPGVPEWLSAVPAAERTSFEAFTSLSQGIGDTAHQYRGHHFVSVVAFLGEQDRSIRSQLLEDARTSLKAARTLWQIAAQELDEGEEPLKYRFWMASSIALHEIIETIASEEEVKPLEHYEALVDQEVRELAMDARSGNPFAIAQQLTQLRALHERAVA